jgi:CubicO group peptidase (beta-lactamase class C family)
MSGGFDPGGLERLSAVMTRHVEHGGVPGLSWIVARGGDVHADAVGTRVNGADAPVARDSIFRIASMSKAVTAAAAMVLVEECVVRLDDPVDVWLPELAGRQVLARPGAALTDTVPAIRPISVRDLLTFRLGWGMDFSMAPQPTMAAMAELGVGMGPPAPQQVPAMDEWLRLMGTLPLEHQPGERWLYHVGADVLGALLTRATGQPLEAVLRERVLDPLGMRDTSFTVAADALDRFGDCTGVEYGTDAEWQYDAVDGQWASPPAFPSAGGGLVSTVDDYLAFARMLLDFGRAGAGRLLSAASVATMTTNHLTPEQAASSGLDPTGSVGWGFGVSVQLRRTGPAEPVGSYGWTGGLGTSWRNDPASGLVGILLTNRAFASPVLPLVHQDFWTCAFAALDD